MHYLSEEHLMTFLLQVLVLLTTAKVLGELCQQRGIPALAGEILTGIILGPTLLGRAFPRLEAKLFPSESIQENMSEHMLHDVIEQNRLGDLIDGLIHQNMLETVSWIGVLFLLLATGFEVNISTVWKQGKVCLTMGAVGVLIAFVIGCVVFWWLPERCWGPNADHMTFTLLLATAAAISAIPVIARILHDLEILKSDFGLTTLSAFIVNDLLGWLAFALVLGLVAPAGRNVQEVSRVFFEIVLFGTVCLTIGSKVVGAITTKLQQSSLPQPAITLTFVCCLGLFCGAITQWIGVHAILGFFLAGIMAGNTPQISENTRQIISQMIHAIFVPLFFATIGIKIDFLQNFDILLVVIVTAVAIGGKFIGGWIGGVAAGLSKPEAFSAGIARTPGGAMEIVLGILALELKLISADVFVALIFAAVSSSVMVGPLLAWSIRRGERIDVSGLLLRGAIDLDLKGPTRWEVIAELCDKIAQATGTLDKQSLVRAVRAREKIMGTGLEKGVAVPHARLKELDVPIVAFGRSRTGIDWDARDGLPTHFVFLVLTPEKEEGIQVQILASIATMMIQSDVPDKILGVEDENEVVALLNESLGLEHLVRKDQPA